MIYRIYFITSVSYKKYSLINYTKIIRNHILLLLYIIIILLTINKLEILFQPSQNHKISDNCFHLCIILFRRLESIISDIILH